MARSLWLSILLCLSDLSWASDEYPPGQAEDLWEWVESEHPVDKTFFRLPDKQGICLYHQAVTDHWFIGTIKEICSNPDSRQCRISHIECHYQSGDQTVVLRESFWLLKSLSGLFLSKPENLYDQFLLKFPFADAGKGLCVIDDKKTNRKMPGWIVTGEKTCKSNEIKSNKYQQFQLIRPSFGSKLGSMLLMTGGFMVASTAVIICYAIVMEILTVFFVTIQNYLYYILLVSAHAQQVNQTPGH